MNDTIDIVDRLRIAWTSCSQKINDERNAAADEIERLRKELADVYSKSAQVIADLSANLCTASALERERITAERDEARRIACENEAAFNRMVYDNSECSDPIEVMRERGWDCFREEG